MHSGDRARVVAPVSFLTLSESLGRNQPAPDFSEQSPEDGHDSFKGSKSTGFVAFEITASKTPTYLQRRRWQRLHRALSKAGQPCAFASLKSAAGTDIKKKGPK